MPMTPTPRRLSLSIARVFALVLLRRCDSQWRQGYAASVNATACFRRSSVARGPVRPRHSISIWRQNNPARMMVPLASLWRFVPIRTTFPVVPRGFNPDLRRSNAAPMMKTFPVFLWGSNPDWRRVDAAFMMNAVPVVLWGFNPDWRQTDAAVQDVE